MARWSALIASVFLACGGGVPHAPDAGPVDAGPMDAGAPFMEATHPDAPQVVEDGGSVLSAPRFIPVFFSNDDTALESQVTQFEQQIGQSDYWKTTTSEYGVGPATAADAVVMKEQATGTLQEGDVESWLQGKIDEQDPQLPQPDANTVYVLHYPPEVTITGSDGTSCDAYGAYHSSVQLESHNQMNVPYIVAPRCHDNQDLPGMTAPLSHEMIETATDPIPPSGFYGTDPNHGYWLLALDGSEVGDLCEHDLFANIVPTGFPYQVQRTWSNQSAAAGHDPCVPNVAGNPYFNSAPELSDWTTFTAADGELLTGMGVHVPEGCTQVIPVDLFSDADTGGPWYLAVIESTPAADGVLGLQLSLDNNQGQNGDKLHLTITTMKANPTHAASFIITSELGLQFHNWVGLVDETPGPCPSAQ